VSSLVLGQTAESKNRPAETVKKAPETAAEKHDFWLKKANSGSVSAMRFLGYGYENGLPKSGIEQDIKKAIYWCTFSYLLLP
jgi:TPR repeat protein